LLFFFKKKYKIKSFPVSLDDIPEIEKANNLVIKVYMAVKRESSYTISLVYRGCQRKAKINLLLYNNHYMLVKNINALLKQFSGDARTMYCEFCGTTSFKNKTALQRHELRCKTDKQVIKMPSQQCVKFNNYNHKINVPFKIYADFESYFETNEANLGVEYERPTAQVNYLKRHKMMGWGYKVVGDKEHSSMVDYDVKKGSLINCVFNNVTLEEDFISNLMISIAQINQVLTTYKPLKMEHIDEIHFQRETICFFCNKPLGSDKVRDHDHLTGKYRCAAHSLCNLKYSQVCDFVPIFFHNFSGNFLFLKK
jgi:hypothetical protein